MISQRKLAAALGVASMCMAIGADSVRTPAWAGKYYPKEPARLARDVDAYLANQSPGKLTSAIRAAVLPLGDYRVTGPLSGRLIAQLPDDTTRIIILGAWHPTYDHLPQDRQAMAGKAAVPNKSVYRTPLGDVRIDAAARELYQASDCFADIPAAHYWEPAIEVILPLLQQRFGDAVTVLPIILAHTVDPTAVAAALSPLLDEEDTVVIASINPGVARNAVGTAAPSQRLTEALVSGDRARLEALSLPDAVALEVLLDLGKDRFWLAKAVSAADLSPADPAEGTAAPSPWGVIAFVDDPNRVSLIRKAAQADWKDPATQAAFENAARASHRPTFQGDLLSPPEEQLLLWLARKSLAAKLANESLPSPPLYSDTLSRKLGCFVTLKKSGVLRGCIGTIIPREPLAASVQRNALAAAFGDKRFPPLDAAELPTVRIDISILTLPEKVTYTNASDLLAQLKPGIHGVMLVYDDAKRATYLPQVWKQLPDKEHFLTNLCHKGKMPLDAWKDPSRMVVKFYETFSFQEDG